jgi:hypothetical protein
LGLFLLNAMSFYFLAALPIKKKFLAALDPKLPVSSSLNSTTHSCKTRVESEVVSSTPTMPALNLPPSLLVNGNFLKMSHAIALRSGYGIMGFNLCSFRV